MFCDDLSVRHLCPSCDEPIPEGREPEGDPRVTLVGTRDSCLRAFAEATDWASVGGLLRKLLASGHPHPIAAANLAAEELDRQEECPGPSRCTYEWLPARPGTTRNLGGWGRVSVVLTLGATFNSVEFFCVPWADWAETSGPQRVAAAKRIPGLTQLTPDPWAQIEDEFDRADMRAAKARSRSPKTRAYSL